MLQLDQHCSGQMFQIQIHALDWVQLLVKLFIVGIDHSQGSLHIPISGLSADRQDVLQ